MKLINLDCIWEKLILVDEDYKDLTKAIATGVGIGTFIGTLFGEVIFFFSLGGTIGVVLSSILIFIRKFK